MGDDGEPGDFNLPSWTNRALRRSRMTSALTCTLKPFALAVAPPAAEGTGEAGVVGHCRSSAITDANVGDIMSDATDALGDNGEDARGGGGDVVRTVLVVEVDARGLQGIMRLANADPNDEGAAEGSDEAGRTRMAKGEADVVGKLTTFLSFSSSFHHESIL